MCWIFKIFKKKSRLDLIKQLIQLRVDGILKEDEKMAFEVTFDLDIDQVKSWSYGVVEGMPESTIVTIVNSYCFAKKRGWDDYEIFKMIENHRSSYDIIPNPKPIPPNPNLKNYIYYRLKFELENEKDFKIGEMGFTRDFIEKAVDVSLNFYSS